MIELQIICSTCGRELHTRPQIETVDELTVKEIESRLEQVDWIVQVNGGTIDTYCSEQCAK